MITNAKYSRTTSQRACKALEQAFYRPLWADLFCNITLRVRKRVRKQTPCRFFTRRCREKITHCEAETWDFHHLKASPRDILVFTAKIDTIETILRLKAVIFNNRCLHHLLRLPQLFKPNFFKNLVERARPVLNLCATGPREAGYWNKACRSKTCVCDTDSKVVGAPIMAKY